jgi:hypothetical protein
VRERERDREKGERERGREEKRDGGAEAGREGDGKGGGERGGDGGGWGGREGGTLSPPLRQLPAVAGGSDLTLVSSAMRRACHAKARQLSEPVSNRSY